MQPNARLLASLSVAALPLLGCRDAGAPWMVDSSDGDFPAFGAAVAFRTDSAAYTLQAVNIGWEGTIRFVYSNPIDEPTYIANCHGGTSMRFERLEGDTWRFAWAPGRLLCLSDPIVTQVGARYEGTVRMFGAYPETNIYPKFPATGVSGTFRIVWEEILRKYDYGQAFGEPLPFAMRTSNRFNLTSAPR